jgi:hypothetical protein
MKKVRRRDGKLMTERPKRIKEIICLDGLSEERFD